jgi:hypothetical protein
VFHLRIDSAHADDFLGRVVEKLYSRRRTQRRVGRSVERHRAALLDRHVGLLRKRDHPLLEGLEVGHGGSLGSQRLATCSR